MQWLVIINTSNENVDHFWVASSRAQLTVKRNQFFFSVCRRINLCANCFYCCGTQDYHWARDLGLSLSCELFFFHSWAPQWAMTLCLNFAGTKFIIRTHENCMHVAHIRLAKCYTKWIFCNSRIWKQDGKIKHNKTGFTMSSITHVASSTKEVQTSHIHTIFSSIIRLNTICVDLE